MANAPKYSEGEIIGTKKVLNIQRRPWMGREDVYSYELCDVGAEGGEMIVMSQTELLELDCFESAAGI